MKNLLKIILFIFPLVFAVSCSDDDNEPVNGYIRFSSKIDRSETRISGDFANGDHIGVYVVPYGDGNTTPGAIWESDYAVNIDHVNNNGSWQVASGGLLFWPGNRHIDVFAYYPYNASLTGTDPRIYDFDIRSDQQTQENYDNSDFLWASNLNLSPTSEVPLLFYHRMSKVNINIRYEVENTDEWIQTLAVSMLNINPGATVNLESGSAVSRENASLVNINPFRHTGTIPDYDVSMTAIIPPQTFVSGQRFMQITIRGINFYYVPQEPLVFTQGTSKNINVTINAQGIEISVSDINEWDDGEIINGNIGESVPRVLDISAIDWTESRVHYIYDDGVLIGQVCREYIYRNSPRVDIPAIVVYPLGTEGRMDHTKGFVAQVFNRTPTSGDQYTVNTANIHGGSVSFADNNTFTAYDEGDQSLINKVEIVSADNIHSSNSPIATLTTQPYTLIDVDNNIYPIVKIGTQYWTMENFRSEHYINGTPLEVYYYNNDRETYRPLLGGLYTWYTTTDANGFVPAGWHMPTYDEWWSLRDYLAPDPATKLKRPYLWQSLTNADNVTGFSGLPGGRRTNTGTYNEIYQYGQFWSDQSNSTADAWRVYLTTGSASIGNGNLNKNYTQSVRLIRDY